jgi:hypothetical protein
MLIVYASVERAGDNLCTVMRLRNCRFPSLSPMVAILALENLHGSTRRECELSRVRLMNFEKKKRGFAFGRESIVQRSLVLFISEFIWERMS